MRPKQAFEYPIQRYIVVTRYHHPRRRRQAIQVGACLLELPAPGPLGKVAAYHEDVWGQAVCRPHQCLAYGGQIMGAEVQV
jgi:hypothetical protein